VFWRGLITGRELRRLGVTWLLLVLLAAAVNVPLAVSRWHPPRALWPAPQVNLGGRAMNRAWPASTPHAGPWPAPGTWQKYSAFGVRHYDVRASSHEQGRNGFAMRLDQYGWPLPVIEDKEMWWDWNDPALSGPRPDPAPRLLLTGLLVNPLLSGSLAFAVFVLPIALAILIRRAWRRHGRQCLRCGYPIGTSPVCTECGAPVAPA
jgi:hypothetical protein